MKKFFTVEDGKINAFYSDDIHGDKIPAEAIEISNEKYSDLLVQQSTGATLIYEDGEPKAVVIEPELEELKNRKLIAINALADTEINFIKASYPESEIDSWSTQEREAVEFTNDNTVETPILSVIGSQRGIEVSELAQKVLNNAASFKVYSGSIIGCRQKLENDVLAATTNEEVNAIDVNQISVLSEQLKAS